MFVLFKKIDTEVFINTPSFADLPRKAPSNVKRKSKGRGGHKRKKPRVEALNQSSTSEVDSPVKRVIIELDTFTDDEQDYQLRNDVVESADESDHDDDRQVFQSEESDNGDDDDDNGV